MTQDNIANFFTFSDVNGTLQINYYPYARLEYQGPEGNFVYPSTSPGRGMTMQEQSFLGQQITWMREGMRWVSSHLVNMHVRWSSLIRNTTRNSNALLPDIFSRSEQKERAYFSLFLTSSETLS